MRHGSAGIARIAVLGVFLCLAVFAASAQTAINVPSGMTGSTSFA